MELQIRKYADTLISWLYANRLRILLVSIVTLILVALSPLPYFNLILTTQFLLFTIMVIGLIALIESFIGYCPCMAWLGIKGKR